VSEPQPHHGVSTNLELPAWLPPPVASYARQISRQTLADKPLLCRLTSDPRMERVWTELLKRKRSNYKKTEAFTHTASTSMDWSPTVRAQHQRVQTLRRTSGRDNEDEARKIEAYARLNRFGDTLTWGGEKLPIQEHALVALFDQAFEFARTASRPVPRAAAKEKRAHYLDMASRIRADVGGLDSLSSRQALVDAAFAYEELADKAAPPPGHPLHVQRQGRGDERQTAFVLQLVDASRAIFGQSFYRTVAIVANVAFECDGWTGERVRKVTKRIRP
jgi:hypothetical protein